jgi:hypothetical protein
VSRNIEYETTTAGQENAGAAKGLLSQVNGYDKGGIAAAAQVHATIAVYEVLADIASELTYMRRLSQESR